MFVGFDSKLITYQVREAIPTPPNGVRLEHFEPIPVKQSYKKVFKFLLGASITIRDKEEFCRTYFENIQNVIKTSGYEPKGYLYDSMLLVSETGYKLIEIVPRLLTLLCNDIERIDLYTAYYTHPMVVFGESQPQTLLPIHFLHLIDTSFPHICASKYIRETKVTDYILEFDHFQLGKTPAWENILQSGNRLNLYYSGDFCNPLISTSDLVIRLIEERLVGDVNEVSTRKALLEGCGILSKNIYFWPLGGYSQEKKFATPRLTLPANTSPYIKHPILFTVGKWPEQFQTTKVFLGMQKWVVEHEGCIKKYEPKDQDLWDHEKDAILILEESERDKLKRLEDFGRNLPHLFSPRDFL